MRPSLSDAEIEALQQAAAFPSDPSAIGGLERVQTHISEVFLSGRRVYKFRKAVDLGFVRFGDRAERNRDCLREVALNRRLAPDVYLGVAPLEGCGRAVRVGPVGEALAGDDSAAPEHCVVMRRLPADRDALSLLQSGRLAPGLVDRLARRIARFHDEAGLGAPAPFTPERWRATCTQPFRDSLAALVASEEPSERRDRAIAVLRGAERFVDRHGDRFEERRAAGFAVDGHGDLHLQHCWFEGDASEPLVVDCLEFDAGLRRIDAAADVAFTAMDLSYRDRADLAERFLRVYTAERDDFTLYGVVDFFAAYRAAVRAKVAALTAGDPRIGAAQRAGASGSAARHLALAAELLARRGAGALVLVAGTVGSGKTTLCERLGEVRPAVALASDRLRKRLAGLAADARGGAALYTADARRCVYRELLRRARPVLASGRTVLLDATWARRRDRAAAAALARELGASFRVLEATCALEVARERLARRAARGADPSDAGPERLEASRGEFEAPAGGERACWQRLRTDTADWQERAARLLGGGEPVEGRPRAPQT